MSVKKTTSSLMHSLDPPSPPSHSPPLTFVSWLPIKPCQRKLPPTKPPLPASALPMSSLTAAQSSATFPWVNLAQWCPGSGQGRSSMSFTTWPTPAADLHSKIGLLQDIFKTNSHDTHQTNQQSDKGASSSQPGNNNNVQVSNQQFFSQRLTYLINCVINMSTRYM